MAPVAFAAGFCRRWMQKTGIAQKGLPMDIVKACVSCHHPLTAPTLDLGDLPLCNRFTDRNAVTPTHKLSVSDCPSCGLVQAVEVAPVDAIVPRLPWIRYNEPEGHLDKVAQTLMLRSDRNTPKTALGVGPFDEPLLARLQNLGCEVERLNLIGDAAPGVGGVGYPYLETMQARLRPEFIGQATSSLADIVVCRYLIEHSHEPVASLAALTQLLEPNGVLLIEVPDSEKFLRALDYCFLWEEHISYFVERTAKALAAQAGLRVERFHRFEGQLEDALVLILRRGEVEPLGTASPEDREVFKRYRTSFASRREAYRSRVASLAAKGKVALIGMGHQSIMFLSALGLHPYISLFVDDSPQKQGLRVPGTTTAIIPSADIVGRSDISACLLAISPRAEITVRAKLKPLSKKGTEILPIYAGIEGKKRLLEAL